MQIAIFKKSSHTTQKSIPLRIMENKWHKI